MPSLLFDARLVLGKPTGIGQYIASLVPELLACAPDWTIHLLRGERPWPEYGILDWRAPNLVHHPTTDRHMTIEQHWRVPRLARRLGVDVLHYPHFDSPVWWGSVPVVTTLFHSPTHPAVTRSFSPAKRMYARLVTAAAVRRSRVVITSSHATAQDLRRVHGATVPIRVTPLAANPIFRPAPPDSVRRFLERRRLERPFALFVGEFRAHKNLSGLLEAWQRTAARATHDLVLAGQSHPGAEPPHAEIRRRGLESEVRVLEGIPQEDLVAAYTAARVFVLPSFFEGFGLPVLEAMACDAPVITSNATATAEVGGEGALLVDPHDSGAIATALDRILGSEEERRRWIEAGRIWRTRFHWKRTAELTHEAYREAIKR